ncbi:MAG: alpha/beta hydrolase [Desulfarculaceae bacterium]|nr:alpha/beta hydrolase [Desulfarculaceae bacterium]MCF8072689.1 alpha/beta hydrolase [Desulfarculaceae bacterium]MCF8102568.1 alpha/beta hydrolase [Desulfarculaceae bacterium]MCF8116477.1 alpha/beta hydrolase [Desulfarculaceae bacterium]
MRSTTSQLSEQKDQYNAHRLYVKIHFDEMEMDFILQWVLGATPFGGCEIGEAFYVVGSIIDGDTQSWREQWAAMAQRVEERAGEQLAAGHPVSARESLLKASNYYRTAVVSALPEEPDFKSLGDQCRAVFRRACPLFDPPMEALDLPFEDTVLPGYFLPADPGGQPRKTLIMIGGIETYAEELYFYIAPAAKARGYNFLTVDIPGQGMLPLEGQFFRPDPEVPLKTVVDFALSRPEVDPEGLAMYGISGGGYFVPRAVIADSRIKACAVNSAVSDMRAQFAGMENCTATPEELAQWSDFHQRNAGVLSWRFGLSSKDIHGLADAAQGFEFDPAGIECPALILVGEGEWANEEVQKQAQDFLAKAANPANKLVITKLEQGASSHCIGGNRTLMSQVLFDWLDEVFAA